MRAEVWHGQGLTERAESDFAQSLQLDPKNWAVHFNRALFHHNTNQPGKARISFTKAHDLAPDWERSRIAATKAFRGYGSVN